MNFLSNLAMHNNKPWFDEHRDEYQAAKEDHVVFIGALIAEMAKIDPAMGELKPKDCIFRIFRDVRFSKDKTPYKAHFGAAFSKSGKKFPGAGYYLHVEPGGKCFAGGGMWMPEPAVLKAVRQEIDYNFKEFEKIVGDKKFKKLFGNVEGERLVKTPQGYAEAHPAIEYLKLKSFTVSNNMPDTDLTGKQAAKKVMEVFTAMQPFVEFLSKATE